MKINPENKRLLFALYAPLAFLIVLWSVKLLETQFGWQLAKYGVYPWVFTNLSGILFEPLIHEDFSHLASNSPPILFLLWALFYFYGEIFFRVFSGVWLLSGTLTWLIGRPAYHIGASGLIYGIAFFIFFSGIIRRARALMALSAVVAFLYGSIVWRMLPITEYFAPEVSWEGHLSGALSGLFFAIILKNKGPQKELYDPTEELEYEGEVPAESQYNENITPNDDVDPEPQDKQRL